MNRHSLITSAVVAGLIVVPVGHAQATAVTRAPGAMRGEHGQPGHERHPAIRAAIRSLEKAKIELQHAAHDFGGHRVEAIEAIDNAIKQLRVALQYDKK